MVEILEKVRLVIKDEVIHVHNFIGEKYIEFLSDSEYFFEKGVIYGLVGECGSGGESISEMLSGNIFGKNIIYFDDIKVDENVVKSNGWYVGKKQYSKGIIKREISVKSALCDAIKKYHKYTNINEVVEDFHLTRNRLGYQLSKYSGEKLRASMAIGYACNKKIYCFPWMNTAYFHDIILSSGVFRLFKKLKEEGCIIILPTSRRENVIGLVDKIIEIDNPQFYYVISDNQYFLDNY